MSEPRSEKNNPENSGDQQEPVTTGSASSDPNEERADSKVAPWTSEVPQVAGPAPMIELDAPVNSGPVKPLGPRRLARLQREMAAHAQEIQKAETANSGEVDQDLLLKQQRFAELALRAAAANEQDRQDAQAALRAADARQGGSTQSGVSAADSTTTGGEETITVSFPQSATIGSSLAADPLTVDPGQFPSSPLAQTSGPNTVSISLVPKAPARPGTKAAAAPAAAAESSEDRAAPRDEPVRAASSPQDRAVDTAAVGDTKPAPQPEREHSSEVKALPVATPSAPEPTPSEQVSAPGTPVRAVDAQGLELLEPNDYKQKSGPLVPLLVLLFLVIAALIAVLIIFVL